MCFSEVAQGVVMETEAGGGIDMTLVSAARQDIDSKPEGVQICLFLVSLSLPASRLSSPVTVRLPFAFRLIRRICLSPQALESLKSSLSLH